MPPNASTKLISLAHGKFALIDATDHEWLSQWAWRCLPNGYVARRALRSWGEVRGKIIYMHQVLLPPKPGYETDHRNLDRLDNRRSNLRYATRAQNAANRPPRSASGYKGVQRVAESKTWRARLDGKHLGSFVTAEEAARAHDVAARAKHGEFAYLNFPDQLRLSHQ